MQFPEDDLSAIERGDLGRELAAATVEEDDLFTHGQPQDGASVVRFGAAEDRSVGMPGVGRDVEAVHEMRKWKIGKRK